MKNWSIEARSQAGIGVALLLACAIAIQQQATGTLGLDALPYLALLLGVGSGACLVLQRIRAGAARDDAAQRKLLHAHRHYRLLVETGHAGIWVLDKNGCGVFANHALGQMLGCQPDALRGQDIYAYLGDNAAATLASMLSSASTATHDLCYRRANGELGWAMVSSCEMLDDAGLPCGTLLLLSDISQRKQVELALAAMQIDLEIRIQVRTADLQKANDQLRAEIAVREAAERALAASERRLHEIISMMPTALFIKDSKLDVVLMNEACAEQWGVTLQEVAGTKGPWICPQKQLDTFFEQDRAVLASGRFEKREVRTWHRGMQEVRILEAYKKPVYDVNGKPLYLIGMTFDITERKRSEAALADSVQQLRQLTAHLETVKEDERQRIARDIHDELGQNLLALKIDVQMLHARTSRHTRLNNRAAAMLATIDATIRSVRAIINDLHPSTLDLGLGPAVEWLAGEIGKRSGIDCRVQVRGEESSDLDPRRAAAVFRIVQESLINVMRHSGATQADVKLDIGNGRMQVEIADDGIGMDPSARGNGGGKFGLRGMHERVGALGGELEIQSSPGAGTRLKMQLPTREENCELETIGEK
jgi:PAS domain S-box-containing protein